MSERALSGRTLVVTRTSDQAGEFTELLEGRGARVIEIPTIEVVPLSSEALDRALGALDRYDWLFFTSVNGVRFFMDRFRELGPASELPSICTIGPATANKVREYGYSVALQPELYQAEGLLEAFTALQEGDLDGSRILLPRAAVAREILPEELSKLGARVDVIAVYETVAPPSSREKLRRVLEEEAIDLVTFTSSSTVRNFVELAGKIDLRGLRCGAIGPITADTAREQGLEVVITPERATIADFVTALEEYFSCL